MALKAYIDEYGIHIPSYPEVLDALKEELRGIYGQDVYLEPDSQEGALCAVFALRLYDCYTLAASVYNAYSPATAQGTGLSSVIKTNGIRRDKAGHSQVDLRVVGQAGTEIKNGVATDDARQRWLLPKQVTIPLPGEITVSAQAEPLGELRAGPGEIKNIATPTRGWQAVLNPEAARPGAAVETDARVRQRQKISTALPSLSIFDGTKGAVAGLPGVLRSQGYENDTDTPDKHGIPPHSICFVVEGGEAQAIGDILTLKKGPGCGTYGDVRVDTRDKYGSPALIRFFRPGIDSAAVFIRIRPLDGYVATTGQTVRRNAAEYINSLPIGESVLLSKLYTPINTAEPDPARRTFDVLEIRLGPKGGALTAANMLVAFNHAAACSLDDVALQEY